jgi:hypothetical protein
LTPVRLRVHCALGGESLSELPAKGEDGEIQIASFRLVREVLTQRALSM